MVYIGPRLVWYIVCNTKRFIKWTTYQVIDSFKKINKVRICSFSYLHVTAGFPPSNSEYFPHLWGISKTITPELPHIAKKLFDWLKSIPSASNLGGSVHKRVWNRDQTMYVEQITMIFFWHALCFLSSENPDNLAFAIWPWTTLCISLDLQSLISIQS